MKHKLYDLADTFVSDDKLSSPVNVPDELREKYVNNFLEKQIRLATMYSGILSPDSFNEYILLGGYEAFKKALFDYKSSDISRIITDSGLRGRGGAGFLTGKKWKILSESNSGDKYVVCNGDEGDPGAFMDRMLLESFPFRIIEGMLIAAYATGAGEGIFYNTCRIPSCCSKNKKCYTTVF